MARRVAVVDVGSNSVRLVVFDGMSRSPAYFYNEKVLCGLGRGLADSGVLHPEGRARAMAALHRFAALVKGMDAEMTGVATAAVREASDGPDFVAQVARETGLALHVASGIEEAQLSARGILLGWPDAQGVVCDIGGASMELARLEQGEIGAAETSALGPLKLQDYAGDLDAHIKDGVKTLVKAVGGQGERLFLVGGSWRALARLDMVRRGYPFHVLHEYRPTVADMLETIDWVRAQDSDELASHTDTSRERLALVPMAGRVLARLLRELAPEQIVLSSYGLREGMFYERMPPSMRGLDPLIEASRSMESAMARFPGFGQVLYEWLRPLYHQADARERRLILAACLLHDTSWQAHPDYRAEMCFESVTRANLGGVDHRERLFLGMAILSRYKNAGHSTLEIPVEELLSKDRIRAAVQLGKAMRLGAMISGAQVRLLDHTALRRVGDTLVLTLAGPARELNGEVVEKRLASLAKQLDLEPVLKVETLPPAE